MRRPYYNKKRYRNYPSSPFEDFADGIVTIYFFYLAYLYFIDKASFWRWVIYGIITLLSIIGLLFIVKRHKDYRVSKVYLPYSRYFYKKPQPTSEAKKLGNLLEKRGWHIEFEKWDGYKHIDIAITEARFNIEIDGSQHNLNTDQAHSDLWRDFYSEQKGFTTKRIPNSLLKDDANAERTAEFLNQILRERVKQLAK